MQIQELLARLGPRRHIRVSGDLERFYVMNQFKIEIDVTSLIKPLLAGRCTPPEVADQLTKILGCWITASYSDLIIHPESRSGWTADGLVCKAALFHIGTYEDDL